MPDSTTGIGSKLSGLSMGLALGALDGGLRGFLVGAGGVFTASAFTGLVGGGFIGNKIGSLAGMLVGALGGLIVGSLEALVKRDANYIGIRIKGGVGIGENWFGKAGSLAGSLLGVMGGGLLGFKIALYAGGMVGVLKGLNEGVKRAKMGFKEGFMAGFTGESQQQPSTLAQPSVETVASTPVPPAQPATRAQLNVGPYLNILQELGILSPIIRQIESRLENPLWKRLMNYVLTEYISPLLRSPVNPSDVVQPSADTNDNKESKSLENPQIDPEVSTPSTSTSLLGLLNNLPPSPSSTMVAQPVNNSVEKKPLFTSATPLIVKPSSEEEKKPRTDNNLNLK